MSRGRIKTRKKLVKFEQRGNQIVVMWGGSRPSVLHWDGNSWVDQFDIGYWLEPDETTIYKVDDSRY